VRGSIAAMVVRARVRHARAAETRALKIQPPLTLVLLSGVGKGRPRTLQSGHTGSLCSSGKAYQPGVHQIARTRRVGSADNVNGERAITKVARGLVLFQER
jgi:hypothetical protein